MHIRTKQQIDDPTCGESCSIKKRKFLQLTYLFIIIKNYFRSYNDNEI